MNLSPNVHKLTLLLGLVTAAMTFFLPLVPISPQLAVAIVGFWGVVTSSIKTFQEVPKKDAAPEGKS